MSRVINVLTRQLQDFRTNFRQSMLYGILVQCAVFRLLGIVEDLGYAATLEDDCADDGADPAAAERAYWLRKFCWSAAFSVPVFLLAMVRHDYSQQSSLCMSAPQH